MPTRREFAASTVLPLLEPALGAAGARPPNLVAFRIGTEHWLTDAPFDALLAFFGTHKASVDELVFFTSATHPPLPLEVMERRAERLAKLLPKVRAAGWKAGINVLSTMGHHEENLPNSLATNWTRVTDPNGKVSLGSFCPAQPELIDYARRIYAMMAKAAPDVLWVDDDVRFNGHMPVGLTCFCDLCLRNFARETGREYSREALIAAFSAGSLDERLALRRLWLEHNRNTIDTLFRNIEEATHAAGPGIPLGFMTGDRFFEGYAFARWARTLAGPRGVEVRWRPGGGFYSDESPDGMVDKANAIGRQVAALPDSVKTIQSELENFPYQLLRKSRNTTVTEAACHMAAGTTGTAFNVLGMMAGDIKEYLPLYDRIAGFRAFYERLGAALGRSVVRGVWPAWNRDSFITVNARGDWLASGRMALSEMYKLGEIGIPMCYDRAGAAVTTLAGDSLLAFSKDELRDIFSRGVLMDVAAWQTMRELGLEKWTGVRDVTGFDRDASEIMTPDAMNGRFAGWGRDCRQSFWRERAYALEASASGARALARLADYAERDLGPSLLASTNELGGRVAVMGYYPWSQFHSTAKSSQIKALCEWLSGGTIPVVVESYARVAVWCRDGVAGKRAVVVLNTSADPIPALDLRVRGEAGAYVHVPADGGERRIAAAPGKAGYAQVRMTGLAPWTIHLLARA